MKDDLIIKLEEHKKKVNLRLKNEDLNSFLNVFKENCKYLSMYVHNFPELSSNDFFESRINKFISLNNIPTSLGGVIQWENINASKILTYDCLTFLQELNIADSDIKVYFSETKLDKEFALDFKSFLDKLNKIHAHFDDLYIYIEDQIFIEISAITHYIYLRN